MPKIIFVQVTGTTAPARVEADEIERSGDLFVLKKGTEQVGEFKATEVQGWWVEVQRGSAKQ